MAATTPCDSCGHPEPEGNLVAVRRVYVTPALSEEHDDLVDVVDEVENWCFPCRSHYPHQPVGADTPEL